MRMFIEVSRSWLEVNWWWGLWDLDDPGAGRMSFRQWLRQWFPWFRFDGRCNGWCCTNKSVTVEWLWLELEFGLGSHGDC